MAISISDRVLTTTEEKYVPVSIDTILNGNSFLSRIFMRETKNWSGRVIQIPMQYQAPTTGGNFVGVETFDTALSNTRVRQTFEDKGYYQSVVLSGREVSKNKTDAEVLDLIKLTMEEANNAMIDGMGDQFYGTGAGDTFQGLGKIVDDGTNSSTYGDLSRTTYTSLNSTVQAAAGGVLSLGLLATIFRAASSSGSAKQSVTSLLLTETIFDLYESLLTPTVRNNIETYGKPVVTAFSKPGTTIKESTSLREGTQGFEVLTWRGRPVIADEKAPSGVIFALNENYLHWYSLKGYGLESYQVGSSQVDSVYSDMSKKTYPIQWKKLQMPDNQYSLVGQFITLGNVISGNTRRHAKATGVTTV